MDVLLKPKTVTLQTKNNLWQNFLPTILLGARLGLRAGSGGRMVLIGRLLRDPGGNGSPGAWRKPLECLEWGNPTPPL